MDIAIQYYKSPVGELIIGVYNNKLCLCDWRYRKMRNSIDNRIQKALNSNYIDEKTELHSQVIKELEEYFNYKREVFNLPLLLVGTLFQKQIWELLSDIVFGGTISYKELSIKFGNIKAIRAVASANGANAISIIIPCHRVIGVNGTLVGYAGGKLVKEKLLNLEKSIENQQLLFFK